MKNNFICYGRKIFLIALCTLSINAGKTAVAAKEITAKAGPILHKITGFTIVAEIPASWTIEKFKSIAKPKAAPDGHVWYVMKGTAANNGTDARSITINAYKILDKTGKEYKADVRNAIYTPEGTGIASIKIAPGETKPWQAFFPIPKTAQGLKLWATDLKLLPKNTANITLPNPDSRPSKPAEGSKTATTAGTKTTKTKAASTPAAKKPAARKDGIKLSELTSAEMGYAILIPEGAKTLQKSKWATTYSLVLKGGVNEINVNLTPMGADSLDELVNTATETGGKEILEKNSLEDGFLVVKKWGPLAQVWLSRKGAKNSVTVKVTVPDAYKALALEIANSLKVIQ